MKLNSESFLMAIELPWEDLGEGVQRKVMGYNADLIMVKFKFKKGGAGTPHHHIHSHGAVVLSGVFELSINCEKK
jgi:quercetin dioxygenase-like cupin family protein